jgi:cyclic 2,3-diphosphoglycerate synthetase
MTRAVAVVDGEHYPPVVEDALRGLPYEVVAAVLVGGTEKLRGEPEYGVPLAASVEEAVAAYAPDLVVDLSDEPVLGPVARMALASRVLALGLPYEGADFRFDPPAFEPIGLPSIAVIGTGKRIGKTAVTGHLAQLLSRDRSVVVVAMGRGGPAEPELVEVPPTLEYLLELSRGGRHAASDHLETAAVAGVPTIGCRRAGGGLAGAVSASNVLEGAGVAAGLDPDIVVFDGSGAALPPVAASARVLVVGGTQDPAVAGGYLNAFRHHISDLVVVVAAAPSDRGARVEMARALVRDDVPVIAAELRPRPLTAVAGRRVAFFGTAPTRAHEWIAEHLREQHGAEVASVSGALADRSRLRAELERVDADVFLVELKAAAVDVVAEEAVRRGVEVVLVSNDIVAAAGQADLDGELQRLAERALTAVPEAA